MEDKTANPVIGKEMKKIFSVSLDKKKNSRNSSN